LSLSVWIIFFGSLFLTPVVFLHYPPRYADQICPEILSVLEEEEITHCFYGHVHSNGIRLAVQGEIEGIHYRLISADALQFCPILVQI
jgi:predicted phosphohydrolase